MVGSSVLARQWRSHLAPPASEYSQRAWLEPTVQTYGSWVRELWQRADDPRPVLSGAQSAALWRRIVAGSSEAAGLLGVDALAVAAQSAWRTLRAADLEPTHLGRLEEADESPDYHAFAGWALAYRRKLDEEDWLEQDDLAALICARGIGGAPESVLIDDSIDNTMQRRLLAHLRAHGWRIGIAAAEHAEQVCKMAAPEHHAELVAAVSWLSERAIRDRNRAALVVPDLPRHEAEVIDLVERVVGSDDWYRLGGERASDKPLIAAALTALELVCGPGDFMTLSRWLRSPFFVTGDAEGTLRAKLEREWRGRVSAQLDFREAFHRGGLRRWLETRAPALERRFAAVWRLLADGGVRRTPTRWVELWSRVLDVLGWQGSDPTTSAAWLGGWEELLASFAELTAVIGPLDGAQACAELASLAERFVWRGPVPEHGLFLAESVEELGPGYAAAWVTGVTDRRWPRPSPVLPLLPRWFLATEERHSEHPLQTAERSFRRLLSVGRSIVLSWPQVDGDIPCSPSPMLLQISGASFASSAGEAARMRSRDSELEIVPDPAPPLATETIGGGSRALALEARCPARAFCEQRLEAQALPLLERGLSRAQRGTTTHAAARVLLEAFPGRASLDDAEPAAIASMVANAADRALREIFGGARSALGRLYRLEHERLSTTLDELVRFERKRARFEIAALESEVELEAFGKRLSLRIDRVDRLDDGRVAVIDYKTGSAPAISQWLAEPPLEPQVPLYALALDLPVVAVAVVRLQRRAVQAHGFWPPDTFAARSAKLPEGRSWHAQLGCWRRGIEQLLEEFIAGDTRVFPAWREEAEGEYAALTRALEWPPDTGATDA